MQLRIISYSFFIMSYEDA